MAALERKYPNEWLMDIDVGKIVIYKGEDRGRRLWIDFFSYDYYADDYTFKEYRDYLSKLRLQMDQIEKTEDIVSFLNEEIEKNVKISKTETGQLASGIDNDESYTASVMNRVTKWMQASEIFPLKMAGFENKQFLVARKEEEMLEYEYGNYMEYPPDLGGEKHGGLGDYLFE